MSDLYTDVTAKIVAELEKGAAPWIKPWNGTIGADVNAVSGRPYNGINRVLLGLSSAVLAYTSSRWATYAQWQQLGCQVAKGEKATHIVFFKPVAGKENPETGETESGYCVIRGYAVFNATQTNFSEPTSPAEEFNPIPACEQTISQTGAIISHGGDRAFYMPSQDRIQMPVKGSFKDEGGYYATIFHELTHWTGSVNRLDRNLSQGKFGNPEYAFEELVAEMGAAFLCADHGIQGELRHAGYIASWLKACREQPKAIFKAAALAQKASDYIKTQRAEIALAA